MITTILSDRTLAVVRRLSVGAIRRMPLVQSFHYDRQLAQKIHELTSHDLYDIIHVEFSFFASYLAAVPPHSQAKKILSMHNVESIRFERELQYKVPISRRLVIQGDRLFFREWEKKAIRQFDGIATVSGLEKKWIQHHAPAALVELVPNGVDTHYFCPTDTSPTPSLVFTGLMNHPPNVDAALWFSDEILPRLHHQHPTLRFNIVGRKPHPTVLALGGRKGIHVTGEVADIRPYIAESLALVVPLRSGGGTRLKILQAMAMGRPVISTKLGAEGLEVTPGVNILIAENPTEFVNHILRLTASPKEAERLGQAGRRLVEEKYDWQTCLRGLENLYEKVLGATSSYQTTSMREQGHILET